MAFPKLLQNIFENSGAGPLFRKDKIPSIEESDVPSVFVKTNAQTFTGTQKLQACTNVSALSTEAQTLTDTQKAQARTNIDAASETELETALTELIAEYS